MRGYSEYFKSFKWTPPKGSQYRRVRGVLVKKVKKVNGCRNQDKKSGEVRS